MVPNNTLRLYNYSLHQIYCPFLYCHLISASHFLRKKLISFHTRKLVNLPFLFSLSTTNRTITIRMTSNAITIPPTTPPATAATFLSLFVVVLSPVPDKPVGHYTCIHAGTDTKPNLHSNRAGSGSQRPELLQVAFSVNGENSESHWKVMTEPSIGIVF